MKKYLTLRNVIVASAVFIALLVFLLSFAVNASGISSISGVSIRVTFKNIVWGSKVMVGTELSTGETHSAVFFEMFGISSTGLNLPVFFGVLLPLIAAIALVVCFFVVKNKKVFTYVVFGAALFFVVGGILQFFSVSGLESALARQLINEGDLTKTEAKQAASLLVSGYNLKVSALSIISAILTILAGGGLVASQFIKDKELVK